LSFGARPVAQPAIAAPALIKKIRLDTFSFINLYSPVIGSGSIGAEWGLYFGRMLWECKKPPELRYSFFPRRRKGNLEMMVFEGYGTGEIARS